MKRRAFVSCCFLVLGTACFLPQAYKVSATRPSRTGGQNWLQLAALPVGATRSPASNPRLLETYGKLPLSFEANQGQTDRRVKFLSRGQGYTLFLMPNEAVLALSKSAAQAEPIDPIQARVFQPQKSFTTALRVTLLGGNPHARVVGMEELPGKSNYFIGSNPKDWRTNVPNYGRVKVHDVYPGVDLEYYGQQRLLEEDFVVAPGADPRAITMEIAGVEKVLIDAQGELVLASPGGEVRFRKPLIYQQAAGVQHEIAGGYKLKGENRVGFELGEYDVTQRLVIDPVLAYSTYLGGSDFDEGYGIAVDSSGNAYVTGSTSSTDFPGASSSPIQSALSGSADAFVTKINAAGSALVYSTYLGGNRGDEGFGIAVDSSGNAYVTGDTDSTDFPGASSSPIQSALGGGLDAFVTKLNAAGSALVYSTYLGGSGFDQGLGIAVDSSGNAYVTGATGSTNFPGASSSPIQSAFGGGAADAFVTKINAAGSVLVYSTYLGGSGGVDRKSGNDVGLGIAVDSSGNAYVTGDTSSTNFPGASSSPIQSANGGFNDAFVAKIETTPAELITELTNTVNSLSLQPGITTQASLAANHIITACNQINAFIHEVMGQSGKELTATQANQLIAQAKLIKTNLGCP